jgi:hypothetical protein
MIRERKLSVTAAWIMYGIGLFGGLLIGMYLQ